MTSDPASGTPSRRPRPGLDRRGFIGALAGTGVALLARPALARPGRSGTDAALREVVAGFDAERARRGVPSVSVALVDGGRIHVQARGLADAARGTAATPATLYQAASISKTIGGLTALALAAQGGLALDADVSGVLKRWPLPPLPEGADRPVTLRRLFGMTAGCNVPGYAGYAPGAPLPDQLQILDGRPPANSPAVRILTPPGRERHYSGGGCQVGQQVLEEAAGRPFAALVAAHVTGPLGLARSGFRTPAGRVGAAAARAHDGQGRRLPGGWRLYPELAAAGFWSTPADLARLVVAMGRAGRGEAVPVLGAGGLPTLLASVDGLGYGLGIARTDDGRIGFKRGNNAGFRSALLAVPATGQGAVVMTNGDDGEAIVDALLDALAQRFGWPARAPWPE